MSQIFHPFTNAVAKLTIFGSVFILGGLGWFAFTVVRSPYQNEVGVARDQPVPFSHKHHVEGLGIDCRYCHTSVEESAFAGIPSTQTCMNCHSVVWKDAPILEPVRQSLQENKPLEWVRVHDLSDFVYFDHSVHIAKGVSCVSCHGQVNEMPLMWRDKSLSMQWCLSCHREPEKELRPVDKVFDMHWKPEQDKEFVHPEIDTGKTVNQLTNCTVCHR